MGALNLTAELAEIKYKDCFICLIITHPTIGRGALSLAAEIGPSINGRLTWHNWSRMKHQLSHLLKDISYEHLCWRQNP